MVLVECWRSSWQSACSHTWASETTTTDATCSPSRCMLLQCMDSKCAGAFSQYVAQPLAWTGLCKCAARYVEVCSIPAHFQDTDAPLRHLWWQLKTGMPSWHMSMDCWHAMHTVPFNARQIFHILSCKDMANDSGQGPHLR